MHSIRIPYLDYARVFVAYLVIFGHLMPEDNQIPRYYIYAFHMPFFFLVSGMLHKLNGTIQWRKYLRTLGIPLLFFNVFFFLFVNPFYFKYVYLDEKIPDGTYWEAVATGFPRLWDGLLGIGNLPSGVTWFLLALIWCKLMMDIIHCHKKIGWAIFFIAFFLTIGLQIKVLLIRNGMMAFPFYYIGCTFKKEIESLIFRRGKLLYACACLLVLIVLTLLNGKVSVYAVGFGSNHLPTPICVSLFYINAMVGSMMILFVSACFKTNNHAVTYIATALITILGVQAVFNDPYRLFCPPDNYPVMIVLSAIILLLCTGIHYLIMRYIPWALGKTK